MRNQGGNKVRFIDLFSGIGGMRIGFENAFNDEFETECVMTSEIKPSAVSTFHANHPDEGIKGDVRLIEASQIPDFDFLLAGFPCQSFSYAGKRKGFADTRGTMFFEIERILKGKKPYGFLLENVEGLKTHDKEYAEDEIGRTFATILDRLSSIGYNVTWKILNSSDFGLPQDRKRMYITGVLNGNVNLDFAPMKHTAISGILESGLPCEDSDFTRRLFSKYDAKSLSGKCINDKRGGNNNIHSWDFSLKGEVSPEEKELLEEIIRFRRNKDIRLTMRDDFGIESTDGVAMTESVISGFHNSPNLREMLKGLVRKGYLTQKNEGWSGDDTVTAYDITAGKLSFPVSKIMDTEGIAPTMTATDMDRNYVIDGNGIRKLSVREGLRLFGYPEGFSLPVSGRKAYDLLGNTVAVPVVTRVCQRLKENYTNTF